MIRAALCTALLALAGVPAAQKLDAEAQKLLASTFAQFDRSGDGRVTRAEFPGSDAQFAEIDADRDGSITLAEFTRSTAAQRLLASVAARTRPPRARVEYTDLAARRLKTALRWDRNGDGAVQRDEWPGADIAFRTLDLDGNGVLDGRDRKLAEANAPRADGEDPLRGFTQPLPDHETLLKRFDRDRDGALSVAEVASADLQRLFATFDRNRDGSLDANELQVLVGQVNAAVARRNAGTRGDIPSLPVIPFSTWDRDKDGRLANAEFEAREWFPRIDVDRDGYVTKKEIERARRALEGATFLQR
ncbi:MAG TPA: hypothetical protein VK081_10930, partial [Planctomycetota bacterium]|nr:hypothetical protein [Planctomycetota bacterium]